METGEVNRKTEIQSVSKYIQNWMNSWIKERVDGWKIWQRRDWRKVMYILSKVGVKLERWTERHKSRCKNEWMVELKKEMMNGRNDKKRLAKSYVFIK